MEEGPKQKARKLLEEACIQRTITALKNAIQTAVEARLDAVEYIQAVEVLRQEQEKESTNTLLERVQILLAEKQELSVKLAAAEQGLQTALAEKQKLASKLASLEADRVDPLVPDHTSRQAVCKPLQGCGTICPGTIGQRRSLLSTSEVPLAPQTPWTTSSLQRAATADGSLVPPPFCKTEDRDRLVRQEDRELAALKPEKFEAPMRLQSRWRAERLESTKEEDCAIVRNIFYGTEGKRGLTVYHEPKLESTSIGALTFGDRVKLLEEKESEDGPTWFRVQSLATRLRGWVIGNIPGQQINCVKMDDYRQTKGRMPEDAYLGQKFPHDGMFTEGYFGNQEICLVSASGDNFWRELNIELLIRDFGTATVFEQGWGGDANFTEWVAFYAFNCALYGNIGTSNPKRLVVTVKPNADYTSYPKTNVVPHDVRDDIGKAQLKECEWLRTNLPKRGFPWESVTFMTTFQFLTRFCKWSQQDCKDAATEKARRVLKAFPEFDRSQMAYQLEMVEGSLREAFNGGIPDDILDILNDMKSQMNRACPYQKFVMRPLWTEPLWEDSWRRISDSRVLTEFEEGSLVRKSAGFVRHFISPPGSPYRLTWDLVGGALIIYDAFQLPLQVFRLPESDFTVASDFVTLAYWTLSIFMSVCEGHIRHGVLEMRFARILLVYLRTWFVIDLVSVVPEWIFAVQFLTMRAESKSGAENSMELVRMEHLHRTVRLIRLFRLRRVLATLNDFLSSESTILIASIVKMIMMLLFTSHCIACMWYAIADARLGTGATTWIDAHGLEGETWYSLYITSLHWSISQFTPSSMNVQPQNSLEGAFAITVVIVAFLGFLYLVGRITDSLTHFRSLSQDMSNQFRTLRRYLRVNQVPKTLSVRIQRYLEHVWQKQRSGVSEPAICRLLSEQLRNELEYARSIPHLLVHPLLEHLNDISTVVTLQRLAVRAIDRRSTARDDLLFYPRDPATHVYFVVLGQLRYHKATDIPGKLVEEDVDSSDYWISEPVLWTPTWVHVGTLVAKTEAELLLIDGDKFGKVIRLDPIVFGLVKRYARTYMNYVSSEPELSDISRGEDISPTLRMFIKQAAQAAEEEEGIVQIPDSPASTLGALRSPSGQLHVVQQGTIGSR